MPTNSGEFLIDFQVRRSQHLGKTPGYDLEDLIAIDWSPVNLEIGDAVGILVTPQGVMQLSLG